MSALLSPEELENSRVAHELIRLKLRVPIVHYLTSIHSKPLRLRWRQLHSESPPNGKLPDRTDFTHYGNDLAGRAKAWNGACGASQQMVDEFAQWLEKPDMARVQAL